MRYPIFGKRKRSVKTLVLSNDIVELLAARVTNAWGRPTWAADRFFERNEIAIVQQSAAPDGVVCVFADLAYLRTFGSDLLRSFGEAHQRSQIGLHVHVYRTTVDDLAQFIEDSRLPPGRWLGLSIDSASAPIYRHRKNLPSYYITARFILVDRLLQLYRRPLTMIDADVEVRRDLASFFDSMRSCDVGLIVRDEDKLDLITDRLKEREDRDFDQFKQRFEGCLWLASAQCVLCLGARLGTEVRALHALGHFTVGIDLNPGRQNAYALHGDFHQIVFPDGSVDAIYTNALDHVFDLDRVIAEVRRLLKPAGVFVVDMVVGFAEGNPAGEFESFAWNSMGTLIQKVCSSGRFTAKESRHLGRASSNLWRQVIFAKLNA